MLDQNNHEKISYMKREKRADTTWNELDSPGTSWNYLERVGKIWNEMKQPTNWQKMQGYCVSNIICQQNMVLPIVFITKSSVLDVVKVSQIWILFMYTLN